jgi:dTDP-4-dehydrorhamnose 3,5-epimerase
MPTFKTRPCPLPGLVLVERMRLADQRGFFSRLFCADALRPVGFDAQIMQINHTLTHRRGTVRGLHYQNAPHSEIKYVSVLRGEVFDVAVDVRASSPTYLQWHSEVLSANNARSLIIPRGFAHGFQTLVDDCELLYLHSEPYIQESEKALHVEDPVLKIQWPLEIADISARDASHAFISPDFTGVTV